MATTMRRRVYEVLEIHDWDEWLPTAVRLSIKLLILLNLVAVIMETVEPYASTYRREFEIFEIASVLIFTVEYVFRSWVSVEGFADRSRGNFVLRLRHAVSPLALVDLIAILPFYLSLLIPVDLRFLRALRLLRILKLTRVSVATSTLHEVVKKEAGVCFAVLFILLVAVVVTASGIFAIEHGVQPGAFADIPSTIWWAFHALITLGFGDAPPVTMWGKIFSALVLLWGVGVVAMITGVLAASFVEEMHIRHKKLEAHLHRHVADGNVSDDDDAAIKTLCEELGIKEDFAAHTLEIAKHALAKKETVCPNCGATVHGGAVRV